MSQYRIFTSLSLITLLSSYASPCLSAPSSGKDEDKTWIEPDLAAEDAVRRAAYHARIAALEAGGNPEFEIAADDPLLDAGIAASLALPAASPQTEHGAAASPAPAKKKKSVSFSSPCSDKETAQARIPGGLTPSGSQPIIEFARGLMTKYHLSPEAAMRYTNQQLRITGTQKICLSDLVPEFHDMIRVADVLNILLSEKFTEGDALLFINKNYPTSGQEFNMTDINTMRNFLALQAQYPKEHPGDLLKEAAPQRSRINYLLTAEICVTAFDIAFEREKDEARALEAVKSHKKETETGQKIHIPKDLSITDINLYRNILAANQEEIAAKEAAKEAEEETEQELAETAHAEAEEIALSAFNDALKDLSDGDAFAMIKYINQLVLRNEKEIDGFGAMDYAPLLKLLLDIDPENRDNIIPHTITILRGIRSLFDEEIKTCVDTLKSLSTTEERASFMAHLKNIATIAQIPLHSVINEIMENLATTPAENREGMIKTITPLIEGQDDSDYIGALLSYMNQLSTSKEQEEFIQNFTPLVQTVTSYSNRKDSEIDLDLEFLLEAYTTKEARAYGKELAELIAEYLRLTSVTETDDITGMMGWFCTQLQSGEPLEKLKENLQFVDTSSDESPPTPVHQDSDDGILGGLPYAPAPTDAEAFLAHAQKNLRDLWIGNGITLQTAYEQYCSIFGKDAYTLEQLTPELSQVPMGRKDTATASVPPHQHLTEFADRVGNGEHPDDAAFNILKKAGQESGDYKKYTDLLIQTMEQANRDADAETTDPSANALVGEAAQILEQQLATPRPSQAFIDSYQEYVAIGVPHEGGLKMANEDHGTAYTMADTIPQ